ncbi:hypothetical protein PVK06_026675 [Gossypium arboreum]|uniref:Aminotransferase-like plant mobile domain-containing protein n=1 Tax=Gossypium arboreum TaxID=29729 RepID=A0ABR0P1R8_GOSAR|nr:hypothetical protein PVK06_026675 [Gossypium arboreum]
MVYDIKHMKKFCNSLHGGLNKLTELWKVERVGMCHQAGSDSLLTSCTFRKLRDNFFNSFIEKYADMVHMVYIVKDLLVFSEWKMCEATKPNKAKIRGCLSLLQSWAQFRFPFLRRRVNQPYTFSLIKRWNYATSYAGIPTALEDIRLLLDQRLKMHFQWTPYEDLAVRAVIPNEFFQNLNIWHVKVLLANYATVEMHQTDRVLRQFGF